MIVIGEYEQHVVETGFIVACQVFRPHSVTCKFCLAAELFHDSCRLSVTVSGHRSPF